MIVIKILGRHNETLAHLDTSAYEHCAGVFIEVSPIDPRREHFPTQPSFPEWNSKRKIAQLREPPVEVS